MLEAEFFYRNPLENDEAKPAFGLEEPDPNNERPNHTGFIKKISNGREERAKKFGEDPGQRLPAILPGFLLNFCNGTPEAIEAIG